jgi:hypothetical protein
MSLGTFQKMNVCLDIIIELILVLLLLFFFFLNYVLCVFLVDKRYSNKASHSGKYNPISPSRIQHQVDELIVFMFVPTCLAYADEVYIGLMQSTTIPTQVRLDIGIH